MNALLRYESKLQDDHVIQVHVGDEDRVYFIQKQLLETTSSFFTTALSSEEAEFGHLYLREGDPKAVRTLIYWIVTRQLPNQNWTIQELMQCWFTGAKYKVCDFQDEAMVKLLYAFDRNEAVDIQTIELVLSEPWGLANKMRKLMAEEAMRGIHLLNTLQQADVDKLTTKDRGFRFQLPQAKANYDRYFDKNGIRTATGSSGTFGVSSRFVLHPNGQREDVPWKAFVYRARGDHTRR